MKVNQAPMKQLVIALIAFLFSLTSAKADELVFVHSPGCMYCEMWRAEVQPMYHKTDEGKRLPLREVNLDQGMPKDLDHLIYPTYTPTFIVLDDNNKEIGRIPGYNEEFFWGFLQALIEKLDKEPKS